MDKKYVKKCKLTGGGGSNLKSNNKFKKYLPLIILLLILVTLTTYAVFNIDIKGLINIESRPAKVSLTYKESEEPLISSETVSSIEDGKTSNNYFEFTISSTSETKVNIPYNIYLTEKEDNTLNREKIYVYLTEVVDGKEIEVIKPVLLTKLLEHKNYKNSYIITSQIFKFINNKEEEKIRIYRLRLWVDNSSSVVVNEDGSTSLSLVGGNYEYTVNVESTNEILNLYYLIESKSTVDNINSKYVNNTVEGIDFSKASNLTDTSGNYINGKGVYTLSSTLNDDYPVYYYRGVVDDNNVLFGDMCFKIVRTTETGGVKLLYNGNSTDGTCDNTLFDSTLSSKTSYSVNFTSLAYVGFKYGKTYSVKNYGSIDGSTYVYANGVSYENGEYKLEDTISYTFDYGTRTTLNNYHYTCFSENDTCSIVKYIVYLGDENSCSNTDYTCTNYIELTNNKKIEDVLDEMVYNSSNENKSVALTKLETWYEKNMINYTEKLENEIWCNDRTIYDLVGYNPNGGNVTSSNLRFNANIRSDTGNLSLSCSNNNDRFTLKEEKGGIKGYGNNELDYPVGLLTSDEFSYAGNFSYLKMNTYTPYYSMSPASFYQYFSLVAYYGKNGGGGTSGTNGQLYIRPSISLYKNTLIKKGTGTSLDPYVIS